MKTTHFSVLIFFLFLLSLSAADQTITKVITHTIPANQDSQSWTEQISMDASLINQGYRFTQHSIAPGDKVAIENPYLSSYFLTFTFRLNKSFIESATGTATVYLTASQGIINNNNNNNPYYNPYYYNQYYSYGWYYPGQSFTFTLQQLRIVNYIEVRWTDSSGSATGTLYIDGANYGAKSVGTSTSGVTARWDINVSGSQGSILIANDATKIFNVFVVYTDGYMENFAPTPNNTVTPYTPPTIITPVQNNVVPAVPVSNPITPPVYTPDSPALPSTTSPITTPVQPSVTVTNPSQPQVLPHVPGYPKLVY